MGVKPCFFAQQNKKTVSDFVILSLSQATKEPAASGQVCQALAMRALLVADPLWLKPSWWTSSRAGCRFWKPTWPTKPGGWTRTKHMFEKLFSSNAFLLLFSWCLPSCAVVARLHFPNCHPSFVFLVLPAVRLWPAVDWYWFWPATLMAAHARLC